MAPNTPKTRRRVKSDTLGAAALFVLSFNLVVNGLDNPAFPFFDEIRYVSGARQFLAAGINENWSQPILGKALIGLGMRLLGDTPVGWRIMSALFGSATVSGLFLWSRALGLRLRSSVLAALLALAGHGIFVQARVATLDAITMGWAVFGLWAFTSGWLDRAPERPAARLKLAAAGALLALSVATKWVSAPLLPVCAALLLWGPDPQRSRSERVSAVAAFLSIFLLVSLLSLALYLRVGQSASSLASLQFRMLRAHWELSRPFHPFSSAWYEWPLMLRPTWFHLQDWTRNDVHFKSGVAFLLNPLLLAGGLIAIAVCGREATLRRSRPALLVCASFAALWLAWIGLPGHPVFFYHFYPACLMLPSAVAMALERARVSWKLRWAGLAAAVALFVFFLPILSNRELPAAEFERRVWRQGWLYSDWYRP